MTVDMGVQVHTLPKLNSGDEGSGEDAKVDGKRQ
jgi:hypothetical protein